MSEHRPANEQQSTSPVVILGAGINGAALARELVLNRVPVWLVDRADVASGTTAYSSRLIHGGLRYLEYAEFDLVRESLAERTRLLKLAPHLVKPLRLYIPVSNRWGGLWTSASRFLGIGGSQGSQRSRGVWWVRFGLWMYDSYARDPTLPRHRSEVTGRPSREPQPKLDSQRFPWVCSYSDAQVAYPERFTLALVEDARRLAASQNTEFRLFTYHRATLSGDQLTLFPTSSTAPFDDEMDLAPAGFVSPRLIVNATGAWVDRTLNSLKIQQEPLLQGTKGTHLFTLSPRLREALRGQAIYGEAADGRPAFILPLGSGTLVGTTDDRYSGPPEQARATEQELSYLIELVNTLVPGVSLGREDVTWHYAGVRPLPKGTSKTTGAITRRHFLVQNPSSSVPLFSIVGGKLTTCRSLAEEATRQILDVLNLPVGENTQNRPLPGGTDYPRNAAELEFELQQLASRHRLSGKQVASCWQLLGTTTRNVLSAEPQDGVCLTGTDLPLHVVRWIIRNEFVRTLEDLVERRLMLMYHSRPTLKMLRLLAALLQEIQGWSKEQVEQQVEQCKSRLESHFGLHVNG